ncbi:plasmid maintenance system antidote protein VapI [Caldanaerobacter subterraneus subsp. tengcongensis MB4]|uniref:Helix-turn-helix n=1 Tax=Caldanaerobacter subterraneus subsp. tengcongensis (strain DSM 15242 / JCM 11007 / NBRC 100824 / MB4) TaxID=273068 RepID=Q8R8F0_CALS4|nr:helix-turn-helix domain-containing protein [Caldanaerobacter subterraneus]AAM25228.1 Helix-turn-helix [Caldanaerobacter subterraneus subsp. tengcongensis MB4]MCS3915175.1 plasmid maintenance system antidote protein VapI [Caldanaerobacter subterraneus subsp. tengcongensis MB4]
MTRPTKCPKCGGELVTIYKTFEVDGHRAENVPVLTCPRCSIFLLDTQLFIDITERAEDFKDKDQLLEELREIKEDEEIRDILKQYTFQNHIKEVLNERGISLRRLANMLDVSPNYIHILTKNQSTSIRTALKMAYALGVDVNRLYTLRRIDEEYKEPSKTLYTRISKEEREQDEKIKEELKKMNVKLYVDEVLKKKGLRRTQLAARLDISPQEMYNIVKIRKGSTGIETALKMAYAIGVDVNELFRLEEVEKEVGE